MGCPGVQNRGSKYPRRRNTAGYWVTIDCPNITPNYSIYSWKKIGGSMRQLPEGKYYLRERLDSEGKAEIYIRYYVNGKRIKKAIGFKCHKENWDEKEERIKGNTPEVLQQNNFLRQFKNKVNLGIATYNGKLSPLVVRNILNQQPADRQTSTKKQTS